jgi:hypothetical protein
MTNLTPAQLEQFESTFRYFDKDDTNTLNQLEMTAALASLGILYSVGVHHLVLVLVLTQRRTTTWTMFTINSYQNMVP